MWTLALIVRIKRHRNKGKVLDIDLSKLGKGDQ